MYKVVIAGAGISGLATAYMLERLAQSAQIPLEIKVLESDARVGGKIWSIREEGFICEWGPNGFLDNKPQTLELCGRLGIRGSLLRSNDNARKRFIYSGGELHRLPENGPSFLKSKLISWPGKLRLAMEPFAPKPSKDTDETLAAFGRRRLGDEALRKLIAPMVSGIFAGDPETMSLKSCFPRIAELESEYGSLIMAMIKLAKKNKEEIAQGKAVASAAGPGGVLTSFNDGLQFLTDTLRNRMNSDAVITNSAVSAVTAGSSVRFKVTTASGEIDADAIILATPAYSTADIVQALNPAMAAFLRMTPYSSMTVVCFGYERDRIRNSLNGFGYLIPKEERRSTLGTLWDSSIFPNRAPAGKVLLRSMLGGACFPEAIRFSDEEVIKRVRDDLQQIMGIREAPSFVRIFRHEKAIPQYTVGHADRLSSLEEMTMSVPGLFLTGNSYRGIGLNDCVAAAVKTATNVISHLRSR
ncbi:MAG: protoporphyrinogen oxidase [Geobacter sp.]|nr:protoporphyrinogen oxidase [Geobacter sp.]